MHYSLKYSIKGFKELLIHHFSSYDDVLAFVHQLHRGVGILGGKQYKGINSFSHFELRKINYEQKLENGIYITCFDSEGHPNIENIHNGFQVIDEDITNIILNECKFTSEENNMTFDGNILCIYGNDFFVKGKTNISSLLTLIFRTQKRLVKDSFSYADILETGSILDIEHSLPKVVDYNFCRDTVKNRFSTIKKELELEEDFIKFSTEGVQIKI